MTPEDLALRFDELVREVRRQGKAAIAAQASADACLEAIGALQPKESSDGAAARSDAASDGPSDVESLVRSLIPVADALERIVGEVERPRAKLSWRERLVGRPARDESLAPPLRLLQSLLEGALEAAGLRADRRVGVPVDGDAHRVVEIANETSRTDTPMVLSVIRPGYAIGDRCLREADVVATAPRHRVTQEVRS